MSISAIKPVSSPTSTALVPEDISVTGTEDDDDIQAKMEESNAEELSKESSRRDREEVTQIERENGSSENRSTRSRSSSLSSQSPSQDSEQPLDDGASSTIPPAGKNSASLQLIIDRISSHWGGSHWLEEQVVEGAQNGSSRLCLLKIEDLSSSTRGESEVPGHYPTKVKEYIQTSFKERYLKSKGGSSNAIVLTDYSKAFTQLCQERGIKRARKLAQEIQGRVKVSRCQFCSDRKIKCIVLEISPVVAPLELGMTGGSCQQCQKRGLVCSASITSNLKISNSSSATSSFKPRSQPESKFMSKAVETLPISKKPKKDSDLLASTLLSKSNDPFPAIYSAPFSLPKRGRPRKKRRDEFFEEAEDEDDSEAIDRECHFIRMKINELKGFLKEAGDENSSANSELGPKKRKSSEQLETEMDESELGNIFQDAELQQAIGDFAREQMEEMRKEEAGKS